MSILALVLAFAALVFVVVNSVGNRHAPTEGPSMPGPDARLRSLARVAVVALPFLLLIGLQPLFA